MSSSIKNEFNEVKQIIFDVGGVLFKFYRGIEKLSEITGVKYQKIFEIWKNLDDSVCLGKISPQEIWDTVNRERDCHSSIKDFDFISFWVSCFQPNLQVHQLIQNLTNKHKVGLLTNIYPNVYQKSIETKNIPDLPYNFTIKSCEVGIVKPNIEIYKLAQELSHQKPENILFIDDKIEFLKPATKLGWHTFLFDTNNPDKSTALLDNIFLCQQ